MRFLLSDDPHYLVLHLLQCGPNKGCLGVFHTSLLTLNSQMGLGLGAGLIGGSYLPSGACIFVSQRELESSITISSILTRIFTFTGCCGS